MPEQEQIDVALKVKKSSPLLKWLNKTNAKTPKISVKVIKELGRSTSIKKAKEFIKSAGLKINGRFDRSSATANSISISVNDYEEKYIPLQIVLPKKQTPMVPFGSVLVNFLLPPGKNKKEAEKSFKKYQPLVLKLAQRLDALPCACITGYKYRQPKHQLDQRGFRLFFSPDPDKCYRNITKILRKEQALIKRLHSASEKEIIKRLYELQEIKYTHSILNDIQFQAQNTELIDLR